MGDILKKVEICQLTQGGVKSHCETVDALIDPGASSTVITSELAKRLRGGVFPHKFDATIEGRKFPLKLIAVKLDAPGCVDDTPLTVVVGSELVARAQHDVEMLLGHDYLQKRHVALQYAERMEAQTAVCAPSTVKRRGRK